MKTRFPDWSHRRLERTALAYAIDVSLACDRDFDPSLTDRLVVNMLRHEFTDYGNHQPFENFDSACSAIAERFPWLRGECARPILHRGAMEAQEADLLAMWGRQERRLREQRQMRAADPVRAIDGIDLGTEITARVRGVQRRGTVTWRGRKRAGITFTIKSGQERTHRLYALEVRPVEAG